MEAGQLDRRITINTRTQVIGTSGARKDGWTPLATVWAQYRPISGRELLTAGEQAAQFDAWFVIRYRSDFTEKDQIIFDGKTWDIQSIEMQGTRKEYLEVRARKLK